MDLLVHIPKDYQAPLLVLVSLTSVSSVPCRSSHLLRWCRHLNTAARLQGHGRETVRLVEEFWWYSSTVSVMVDRFLF